MSQFKINSITDKSGYCGPVIAGVSTNNSTGCMIIPAGPTEHRGGRGRAVFAGGMTPSVVDTMDKVEIATTGNAVDFGNMSAVALNHGGTGMCNSTRGVIKFGTTPDTTTVSSTLEYVIISSSGGTNDFGDTTVAKRETNCLSNATRGLIFGGTITPETSVIEFITIATTGSANGFGSLLQAARGMGGVGNATRGLIGGGYNGSSFINTIEFVTIATTGDSQDFGDLSGARMNAAAVGSSTRAVFGGGYTSSPHINSLEYVEFATKGNVTDFGDFSVGGGERGATSNNTRGVFGGQHSGSSPNRLNNIEYITIASVGNATDFGDLTSARSGAVGLGDAHGGLAR